MSKVDTKQRTYNLKVDCLNILLSEAENTDLEEFLIRYVDQYPSLLELSRGYVNLEKKGKLANELEEIKANGGFDDLYPKVSESFEHIIGFNVIDQRYIKSNDIDGYFGLGEIWNFPEGVHGRMQGRGMRLLKNFPLNGEELYDFLRTDKGYYKILSEYGVYPNLPEEDILKCDKLYLYPDWEVAVENNDYVLPNRMESLFQIKTNRIMHEGKYEDKFYIYFSYKKYTPSQTVIDQVREYAIEYVEPQFLPDLEIIFWPTFYEGFKKMRELFDDENGKYKFTGEEIRITFDK